MAEEKDQFEGMYESVKDMAAELKAARKSITSPDAKMLAEIMLGYVHPFMASMGKFVADKSGYDDERFEELDERVGRLEDGQVNTQITPEDAEKIIAYIMTANSVMKQVLAATTGEDKAKLAQIIETGDKLIEAVRAVTIQEEEEDEEDEEEGDDEQEERDVQ